MTRLLTLLLLACAVPAAYADSIALIKSYDSEPYDAAISGFLNSCGNEVKTYNLEGESGGSDELISSITGSPPDLIVAIGVLAAEFSHQNFSNVPVLYAMVPEPQAYGLTGSNIAGISLDIPIERQLTVYRSMVKDLKSLGAIYDPEKSGAFVEEAKAVAHRLGLVLHTREVESQKQVPAALRALVNEEQIDALWMIPDPTVLSPESFKFLLLSSFENDLPFLAASDIFVKVGALASLTPDYTDVGRQGCELATALKNGELSFAKVDVVGPAKINLSINLKTAQKIGLTIPEEVIATADVVYE
ncbi:MAG TPA: ABC transporter substrate binding protein [Woeseiaceae bacterium]|nr:ABC transporter substrate binding protein [Woeseiaceae bacterium]